MEKVKALKIKPLPTELLIRSLCNLSLIDRLKCESVSPGWKWIVGEFGWTEEKTLDFDSIFDGTTPENADRFIQRFYDPTDGKHNVVSLLYRIGPNLVELDLAFLRHSSLLGFLPEIAESFQMVKKLEKLHIRDFQLADFVAYLPSTLRQLHTSTKFDEFDEQTHYDYIQNISLKTMETLSENCPNLEEVPFDNVSGLNMDILNKLIGKFPRQKRLNIQEVVYDSITDPFNPTGKLTSNLELKELEVFEAFEPWFKTGFDDESFEAMVTGCTRIREIYIYGFVPLALTEESLLLLAMLPNLTVLELNHYCVRELSGTVLREIAKQGKLKKLYLQSSEELNPIEDDAIVYLIEQCKSLVSLELYDCLITDRSLDAVVAEVHRRHGSAPWRSLPLGPWDSRVFYFSCIDADIDEDRARQMAAENPWLIVVFNEEGPIYQDPRRLF